MKQMNNQTSVIETQNLKKYYKRNTGFVDSLLGRGQNIKAVDDVTFSLEQENVVGVIGESGCGKTTLLHTMLGFHKPTEGEIIYQDDNIFDYNKQQWKEYRRNVQVVFQDPFDSLNPKHTVRKALKEPLQVHGIENMTEKVIETLEKVELNPADRYLDRYPHQLSGGEKQRVSIARALVLEPDILLADEPVSMLDVSTQASILNLLSDLIDDMGLSVIYISHDLSTVSYICDEIHVMYLGRIVETATTKRIIEDPKHPYTQELINSIPVPDPDNNRERTQLEGSTPDPVDLGDGCRFRDRCPEAMEVCGLTPEMVSLDDEREIACHLYYDDPRGGDQ